MDTVLQTIGLVAIALALVGLLVTLVFIRRETRVRARWDLLRLLLGAATLVVSSLIAGAALQPAVVVAAGALGLALGLMQGSTLRVRVAGKSVYVRRDGVGILLWGIGVVLASGGGLASSLGILALGQLVGWFGVGMQGGQFVGRWRAVGRAVAAVAPGAAAVLLASWLTLDTGGGVTVAADFACPDSLDGLPLNPRIGGAGEGPYGEFTCYYNPADFSVWSSVSANWIPPDADQASIDNLASVYCERTDETYEDANRPQELYGWVFPVAGERMVLGSYEGDTGGASVASMQALARSMAEAKADEAAPCPAASGGDGDIASTPPDGPGSPPPDDSGSPTSGSPTEDDGFLDSLAGGVTSGEAPDPEAAVAATALGALGVGAALTTAIAEGGRRGRRTSISLTGDAARAALAAGIGAPIEIPEEQRWGVHVRAGNQVESSDFLGHRGRITGVPVIVQGEGGEIAISVDIDIEGAAAAPTPAPAAGPATDVAAPSPEPPVAPEMPEAAQAAEAAEVPEAAQAAEAPAVEPPAPAEMEVSPAIPESDAAPPFAAGSPVDTTPPVGPTPPAESGQPAAGADAGVPGPPVNEIRSEIEQQFGPDGAAAVNPILDRAEAVRAAGGGTMTVSAEEVAALAGLDAKERIQGITFREGYVIVHTAGFPPIPVHPTVDRATGRVGVEFGTGGLDSVLIEPLVRQVTATFGIDPDKLLDGLNDLIRRTGLQPQGITISEAGFAVDATASGSAAGGASESGDGGAG